MADPTDRLAPGERVFAVFRENDHAPVDPDPAGSVEEFRSVQRALDTFERRVTTGRSAFFPARTFGPPPARVWIAVDNTAYMDVWVQVPGRGEEILPPDCYWQRWTHDGNDIVRQNF